MNRPDPDYTTDEIICTCISHQIRDGEIVAQGIATPLVAAGYLLAKLTHAPDLMFVSAIGQAFCYDWAPLGLATIEQLWIQKGVLTMSFVTAACEFLPRFGPKEFFRPGQVDAQGNFNNVFIGDSYTEPRFRLPGAGGIPDVTVFEENMHLYVPRHGRHTFVEKIDFCSGLGHHTSRTAGHGPQYLVSDLGQFDYEPESGRMRVLSLHPGVTDRQVQAKTGFELLFPDPIPTTTLPTAEEIYLLRHKIDPLGVRMLETLPGRMRRQKMHEILLAEKQMLAQQA